MKKFQKYAGILMILFGLIGIFFMSRAGVGNIAGRAVTELNESYPIQEPTQNHESISIKQIKYQNSNLDINYFFDNSKFIGEQVSVEIWISDEQKIEIKRYTDTFSIKRDNPIERNLVLTLPKSQTGFYNVYFALSNNQKDYVKQSVMIGKSKTTGNSILNTSKPKFISYAIFLIIIGGGIFLIIKNRDKKIHATRENLSHSKVNE